MTEPQIWIGADPGGKSNFGIALWQDGERPETACVDCAANAIKYVEQRLQGRRLSGIGVDAPLWWSAGVSSDRLADKWLRKKYNLTGGQVQTANSLRGAALVQAVMFVEQVRRKIDLDAPVTEVHPKALLKVLTNGDWREFCLKYRVPSSDSTEHERDALIAAVAAREGLSGFWPNDLSLRRDPEEQDPKGYWLAPIFYYWPEW